MRFAKLFAICIETGEGGGGECGERAGEKWRENVQGYEMRDFVRIYLLNTHRQTDKQTGKQWFIAIDFSNSVCDNHLNYADDAVLLSQTVSSVNAC